jgi:hypothetical protein
MWTTPFPDYFCRIGANLMSTVFIAILSLLSLMGCLRSQVAHGSSGQIWVGQRRKHRQIV